MHEAFKDREPIVNHKTRAWLTGFGLAFIVGVLMLSSLFVLWWVTYGDPPPRFR